MDIFDMKKSDFDNIPMVEWDEEVKFTDLVIIPTDDFHESGYRCMKFCAVNNGKPIAMLGGISDVMHLDGIGGHGMGNYGVSTTSAIKAWNMDCLPCGYLHMWCSGYNFSATGGLSDFELFTEKRRKKDND